jgi:hypothetical protein
VRGMAEGAGPAWQEPGAGSGNSEPPRGSGRAGRGAARRRAPRGPHLLAGVDGALHVGADVLAELAEQEPGGGVCESGLLFVSKRLVGGAAGAQPRPPPLSPAATPNTRPRPT